MELIIVLGVVAIVGYIIYQSLPNTKFEKAQDLFNNKDYVQAINVLNEIFEKHIDAPAKLAEIKLNLGKQASEKSDRIKLFNEVVDIRKRISKSESIANFEGIESSALLEIAIIQYEEANGDIDKLKQNVRYIDSANKKGLEPDFINLKKKHFYDLAENYFKKATDNEKSENLLEAIQSYNIGKDFAKKSDNEIIEYNSVTRIAICQLKRNDKINLDNVSEIGNSDRSYQIELYYRYAIYLIKNKEYSEAEKVISAHLNFKSFDIDKLSEILKSEKNNNAVKKIEEINYSIEQLQKKSLSTEKIAEFYYSLDKSISEIKVIDSQVAKKISDLKPPLFNRLLTHYISEEQYGNAIKIIYDYPLFWESPELLKNLGICCFGFTAKGLLTERNYQSVISGWLTSVFSDKVILKSLDDTTWDDNYTFTLVEAIGSNYLQHEETPENVNYNEISEINISIGATQKELVQQFETIIHKEIKDSNLAQLVNNFYDREKEALEKVISVIENDILFATPHFAKQNGLNNVIIEELDKDYHNYLNEDALEAGVPYINNSNSTVVYQYFFANNLLDRVVSAIESDNSSAIKKLNTNDYKQWLEKFETISSSAEDKLFTAISNKITEDKENENLIHVMEECILFSRQNAKLKHQYSNYVANYCISKVNDEGIDNFKALTLMKGAYLHSPNSPKIVKNFITLIRFNLMDILNENTEKMNEIYAILDWIKQNNMSQIFKQNSKELSIARREILQQLEKVGADISPFDGSSLSSILSSHFLNSKGLTMKKVLSYLKELGND